MFQFPALAPQLDEVISLQDIGLSHSDQLDEVISLQDIGLSHSEIHGSKVICTSP